MLKEIKNEMETKTINLNDLIVKYSNSELRNDDFTKMWTKVVMLPLSRIEYIISESAHTKNGYDIDQALYYGILNRIGKVLSFERRLVCCDMLDMEFAQIISRILLEDNIVLEYFLRHPEKLDEYRKSAFKAEKEYEDFIIKNREERVENDKVMFEWEEGLLKSIHKAYASAGLTSETTHASRLPSPPKVKTMAEEVGLGDFYSVYKMQCHAAHGDWYGIYEQYLREENGKYFPSFTKKKPDIRIMNPMLRFVYKTLLEFIDYNKGHCLKPELKDELNDDDRLIQNLDTMHFNFLKNQPLTKGVH